MSPDLREQLKKELVLRGFRGATSACDTMTLDDEYLADVTLSELMDQLVTRREKIFRSVDVVGTESAKRSYSDVVAAIDALRTVVDRLDLPREDKPDRG